MHSLKGLAAWEQGGHPGLGGVDEGSPPLPKMLRGFCLLPTVGQRVTGGDPCLCGLHRICSHQAASSPCLPFFSRKGNLTASKMSNQKGKAEKTQGSVRREAAEVAFLSAALGTGRAFTQRKAEGVLTSCSRLRPPMPPGLWLRGSEHNPLITPRGCA